MNALVNLKIAIDNKVISSLLKVASQRVFAENLGCLPAEIGFAAKNPLGRDFFDSQVGLNAAIQYATM
jgi:hypothetical protein